MVEKILYSTTRIWYGFPFKFKYRKFPLKNTGDTLKGPDWTVLVTAHWVFLIEAHDILNFEFNGS
jgi:hypothetical protein